MMILSPRDIMEKQTRHDPFHSSMVSLGGQEGSHVLLIIAKGYKPHMFLTSHLCIRILCSSDIILMKGRKIVQVLPAWLGKCQTWICNKILKSPLYSLPRNRLIEMT